MRKQNNYLNHIFFCYWLQILLLYWIVFDKYKRVQKETRRWEIDTNSSETIPKLFGLIVVQWLFSKYV